MIFAELQCQNHIGHIANLSGVFLWTIHLITAACWMFVSGLQASPLPSEKWMKNSMSDVHRSFLATCFSMPKKT